MSLDVLRTSPPCLMSLAVPETASCPSPAAAAIEGSNAELEFIENVTRNAGSVQESVLEEILTRNADTEYLRQFGLGGNSSSHRDVYKRTAPIVYHENLQPFIRRIANGEPSTLLCAEPITEFLTSSGTSGGERKLIPTTEDEHARRSLYYRLLSAVSKQCTDGLDGKRMVFMFSKAETKTPSGLPAMPTLTSHYKSKWFLRQPEVAGKLLTSPLEAIFCSDVEQSLYCQLLCGLLYRKEVVHMGAVFASTFLRAMRFLQERWPQLVEDIRERKLDNRTVTDRSLRKAVEATLAEKGGTATAAEIERECENVNWQGIIKRLWPRAKAVDAILTGAMAQYVPALEFYAADIPLVSLLYASSESYFAINLSPFSPPSEVSYTMIPNLGYFEFLPVSEEPLPSNLVDLVDVEEGKQYELVVTSYTGLYRYRMGDVLQVTGFHHKSPQVRFVSRHNVLLAIDSDKTDEGTLHRAITAATSKHFGGGTEHRLVDYTSFADLNSSPGHYVLFWEIGGSQFTDVGDRQEGSLPGTHVLEECCVGVEDGLDAVYRQCRVSDKSIGPLEIRVVSPGTFDALMDYSVARGGSIGQYKQPRCVKPGPLVDLLNSRVTRRFFSPRYPFWTSERADWARS